MHPQKTGVMLGFFLLTLLSIASFVDGKAFPGDKTEGNYDYYSKQELGSQHQPFYRHQSFPPKTNLYYTPHVNGQPIFIPAISGSASPTDKLLDDYYERYKEYTQSWTLATPVTYNYDHGSQRDYYEDPMTSDSMVKNLLDDTYQDGVHRGNYHILPVTRESNLNHVTKQTEDLKYKNKQNIRKMDKKKMVEDSHGLSTKSPVSVNYDTKPVVSKDYSAGVSETINKKLSDFDYAPEVVEVIETNVADDDYAPEVVQIIGNTFSDDDYAEGKAEVFNEKLPDKSYAQQVKEVIRTEISDEDLNPGVVEIIGGTFPDHDYAPEVVEVVNKKRPHDNYASEVVDVVNIKDHGRKKHYPFKSELLWENIEDEDSDEVTDQDIFTSKKDKAKIKSDKKAVKKPSKSSSKTDYEEIEFVTKTSHKKKNYQSPFTEELEPISEHLKTVEIKLDLRPDTENFDEFKKADKTKGKSDKKSVKKPSKSSSKTDDYEEIEIVTKTSDKKKNTSLYTEERETITDQSSGHLRTVERMPDLRPATENLDEFKKTDKTKGKSDKKAGKKPSKSSSKTGDYEEIEIITKTSDKKNKYQFRFTEEHETIGEQSSEHLKTVMTNPDLRPATENLDEFKKTGKTKVKSDKKNEKKPSSTSSKPGDYEVTELVTKKPDTIQESSQKIRTESGIKYSSEDEYITDQKHKVIKRKDEFIDDSESSLVEDGKNERSGLETIKNLSEHAFLDESDEELGLGANEALSKEPLSNTERFEAFDLENVGSGEPQDENIRSGLQFFHNTDSIRSLSSLNSNIWSLIFNPNAEFKKSKKCVTRSNETGFCMYLQQCDVPNVITSLEELLNNACVIDDVFIGICCPEFPVQTVKVQWEQMPSNFGEHTEDEFGHNAEDCGIRSDEASKAKSWPWKAPLVSMSNGKIFCGGVIINEDYILTAAHCTTKIPRNQILVRLGQHDDSSGEDFAVVEIKRHAQYNPRTMHNDIALLKLGRRIVRDEQTDAACLPDDDDDHEKEDDDHEKEDDDHEKEDDHAGERAVLLGWQRSFSKRSVKDEVLEVLTNEECKKRLGIKVPPTFLCTEPRREDERTCNADSGAPLVIKDDGKYEVIGILSWNRDDCDQRFPSTFSRVSKYVQWIKKHAV